MAIKKTIFMILAVLAITSVAHASPFEVCDPQAGVAYYVITGQATCLGDGTNIPAQADGSLKLDLACVAKETVWATGVKCCDVWDSCSTPIVNFAYSRMTPYIPVNVKVIKTVAGPRMVCDPNSSNIGGYYVITSLPSCMGTGLNISAQPDGSLSIDPSCIPVGTNASTTLKTCNLWGDCSATVPFALVRPTGPVAPTGLKLSK